MIKFKNTTWKGFRGKHNRKRYTRNVRARYVYNVNRNKRAYSNKKDRII